MRIVNKEEYIERWNQLRKSKIEEMNENEIMEIIRSAMDVDLVSEIRVIPYIGNSSESVKYKTDELIARCPMTGLPDYYKLEIRYVPNKVIPELKSVKMYLIQYIDFPISHEHLASKIYKDFVSKINPIYIYVSLDVARRGGIDTKIEVKSD